MITESDDMMSANHLVTASPSRNGCAKQCKSEPPTLARLRELSHALNYEDTINNYFFDHSSDLMAVVDEDLNFVRANCALRRIIRADPTAQSLIDFVHPDDVCGVREEMAIGSENFRCRIRNNHDFIYVEFTVAPIGEYFNLIGLALDHPSLPSRETKTTRRSYASPSSNQN